MANLYLMTRDWKNKQFFMKKFEIIAETEFHWTIRGDRQTAVVVSKKTGSGYCTRPEAAYEFYSNSIDREIGRYQVLREDYINQLRGLEEAKESLLKE